MLSRGVCVFFLRVGRTSFQQLRAIIKAVFWNAQGLASGKKAKEGPGVSSTGWEDELQREAPLTEVWENREGDDELAWSLQTEGATGSPGFQEWY